MGFGFGFCSFPNSVDGEEIELVPADPDSVPELEHEVESLFIQHAIITKNNNRIAIIIFGVSFDIYVL